MAADAPKLGSMTTTRVRKLPTPCGKSGGTIGGAVRYSAKSRKGKGIFRWLIYRTAILVINSGEANLTYSCQSLRASSRMLSHFSYGFSLLKVNPSNLA